MGWMPQVQPSLGKLLEGKGAAAGPLGLTLRGRQVWSR